MGNLYVPGCNEHLILHKLRDNAAFVPELDFVALKDNKIVGNIVYTRAAVIYSSGKFHEVLSFGPISVLPKFQNQGIGAALINHSTKVAKEIGFKAIIIYGNPDYYQKLGFKKCQDFNITKPDGNFLDALLALELTENSLKYIKGRFYEDPIYEITQDELADFDKTFPQREKVITESQKVFAEAIKNTIYAKIQK